MDTMKMLILILVFFAGCSLGHLNAFIESKLLQKILGEKLVIKDKFFRTILFGIIFLTISLMVPDFGKAVYIFTMFFICYLVAMVDLKSLIIPNKLVLTILIASGAFIMLGLQPTELQSAFIGLLVGFAMMAVPYFMGVGIGGGDVKLLAVIGFCVGYMGVLYILIFVGILSLIYMVVKSIISRTNIMFALKDMIPMGPFISLSFILFIIAQSIGI